MHVNHTKLFVLVSFFQLLNRLNHDNQYIDMMVQIKCNIYSVYSVYNNTYNKTFLQHIMHVKL